MKINAGRVPSRYTQVQNSTEKALARYPQNEALASVGGSGEALPCLSGINCRKTINTGVQKNGNRLTSVQYRTVWGLRQNIQHWEQAFGLEKLGFFTVTCRENISDKREFARRWKRYRNHFEDAGIETVLVKVDEPQKRGAWHAHCVIRLKKDIRTGFDFEAYKEAKGVDKSIWQAGGYKVASKALRARHRALTKRYGASASPLLRSLWYRLGKAARKSGFGRVEVTPVRHGKAVSEYVGGYLSKGLQVKTEATYRMRKINYCRGIERTVKGSFQWAFGKSQEWRKNLGAWAKFHGLPNDDFKALRRKFGKRWAYTNFESITHIGQRERFLSGLYDPPDLPRKRMEYDATSAGFSESELQQFLH